MARDLNVYLGNQWAGRIKDLEVTLVGICTNLLCDTLVNWLPLISNLLRQQRG